MKLLLNAIRCLSCDEVIVSKDRHDFKTCKCGKVSVDGGLDYKRRAGSLDGYVEHCAYTHSEHSKSGEATGKFIVWSPGGRTNPGVIFDQKSDAELSAKELAARILGDWYVAQLSSVTKP